MHQHKVARLLQSAVDAISTGIIITTLIRPLEELGALISHLEYMKKRATIQRTMLKACRPNGGSAWNTLASTASALIDPRVSPYPCNQT
jgi:hypothetical protein